MALNFSDPAAKRRFEAYQNTDPDNNYNYHHQKSPDNNQGKSSLSHPKPIGDDDKQPKRFDLMPYAQAANEADWCKYAQEIWHVDPGVIVNGFHGLGYHRVKQIYDKVKGMDSYRFNSGKYKEESRGRGAYFRACLVNEITRVGKVWGAR